MNRLTILFWLLLLGMIGSSVVLYVAGADRRARLEASFARLEEIQLRMEELKPRIEQARTEAPDRQEFMALQSELDRLSQDLENELARDPAETVAHDWVIFIAAISTGCFGIGSAVTSIKMVTGQTAKARHSGASDTEGPAVSLSSETPMPQEDATLKKPAD